jgi:hypothetical protein
LEERGTIGFYAERSQGETWTPINTEMLPGLIAAPLALAQQEVAQDAVWEKFRPLSEGFAQTSVSSADRRSVIRA